MSGLMEQLSKVRAEAAECALVGNLATDPQKKQMYMRLADHLTTLAAEVERAARERVPAEQACLAIHAAMARRGFSPAPGRF